MILDKSKAHYILSGSTGGSNFQLRTITDETLESIKKDGSIGSREFVLDAKYNIVEGVLHMVGEYCQSVRIAYDYSYDRPVTEEELKHYQELYYISDDKVTDRFKYKFWPFTAFKAQKKIEMGHYLQRKTVRKNYTTSNFKIIKEVEFI